MHLDTDGTAFGSIVPSSNTVVERVTGEILHDLPDVSAHFSRFAFHGDKDPFPLSYDWDGMLLAARLLSHAHLPLICWNGTKGGSIGFEHDRVLCRRIREETGATSTTATLALAEALETGGLRRLAFVTPYRAEFQDRIRATWSAEGYELAPDVCAGLSDNYSYSTLPANTIEAMALEAAKVQPQAILLYCTNMNGARAAVQIEKRTGIPTYDSVVATVAKCLSVLGIEGVSAAKWGSLFARPK